MGHGLRRMACPHIRLSVYSKCEFLPPTYNFTIRHPFQSDDNMLYRPEKDVYRHLPKISLFLSAKFVAYLEVFIRLYVS